MNNFYTLWTVCLIDNIQYTSYNVHHTMYIIQCTSYNVHHIQYPIRESCCDWTLGLFRLIIPTAIRTCNGCDEVIQA
jgi:hypothetical protein